MTPPRQYAADCGTGHSASGFGWGGGRSIGRVGCGFVEGAAGGGGGLNPPVPRVPTLAPAQAHLANTERDPQKDRSGGLPPDYCSSGPFGGGGGGGGVGHWLWRMERV